MLGILDKNCRHNIGSQSDARGIGVLGIFGIVDGTFGIIAGIGGIGIGGIGIGGMSRAETTPPQQAGAPARVSRQGGGRFGRQLLAPRSGPNQLLHPR